MTDDALEERAPSAERVEVPHEQLAPEVLRRLIEEFVTRDGTDYGAVERTLGEKVAAVIRQLAAGELAIVVDTQGRDDRHRRPAAFLAAGEISEEREESAAMSQHDAAPKSDAFFQFSGTQGYIASSALVDAVNCAIALERPLLIKGEPGTGKTLLAQHVAEGLGMPIERWHIKSTTKAQEGLYVYDTVQRLNDARFGEGDVSNIRAYIRMGPLGRSLPGRAAPRAADRRGRQGRPRVPERPAARARRDALHGLRDERRGGREAAAGRDHHLEQREGAAGRVPAPLRLPLHRVPGQGADEADHRGAPSRT